MSRLEEVIEKWGGECVWCGRELWMCEMTIEHVCPRSKRGITTPENLLPACKACNHARRSKSVISYAKTRLEEGLSPRVKEIIQALQALKQSPRKAHSEYARNQLRHADSLLSSSL